MKNYKRMYRVAKEMRDHYEDLFRTGMKELQHERIRAETLLNSLQKIEETTNDPIAKRLCAMARETYILDGLIHARKLFE